MANLHQHGGKLKKTALKYNLNPQDIIDFSANINFLGPPAAILKAIKNNLSQLKNYPEINSQSLKKLIAKKHQLQTEKITVANGAAEMIYQLTKVLNPKKVMVMAPTFSEYELAAEAAGAKIEHFFLKNQNDFQLDLDKLGAVLTEDLDLLFICNPNNPTAQLFKAAELNDLIKRAEEKEIKVVVDEAFIDFLEKPAEYSVIKFLNQFDNLVILKSMTKLFAIPGLRLGYLLTNEDLSSELESKRDPWSVNYFSQLAGEIIFQEEQEIKDYVQKSRKKIAVEREYLVNELQKIKKLKVYPPTTNYIFIDISASSYKAAELKNKLAASALLIRSCDSYRALKNNYIRIAVKDRDSNNILIEKLKELLN